MNQSEFKANTCNRHQARENACERDAIGFNSHWLREWREFYQPITARSNAKPKQKRNRPFPSCCKPHYEGEAKCKTFHIKIRFVCI